MRGMLDFSSWSGLLTTLVGLVLMTLLMVGIRLVFMQTIQRRRERENRQINERLRTLIAAYKTLGGSFTGELAVDPTHLRDLRRLQEEGEDVREVAGSERQRRIRDAVESALSDIILLGTEEQVRLAAAAAADMVAGRRVETAALVVSLRDFIRQALDLAPIPPDIRVPSQGPVRVATAGAGKRGAGSERQAGGREAGGGGAGGGGAGGAGGGAAAGGAGMGLGLAAGGRGEEGPLDGSS